mmetsp:Transcript_34509/g.109563  ORF Transcript_34509/g.109563 Transcript_34509/m.109563 type:complete len:331 (-) Transcript_34509:376-1368(-)
MCSWTTGLTMSWRSSRGSRPRISPGACPPRTPPTPAPLSWPMSRSFCSALTRCQCRSRSASARPRRPVRAPQLRGPCWSATHGGSTRTARGACGGATRQALRTTSSSRATLPGACTMTVVAAFGGTILLPAAGSTPRSRRLRQPAGRAACEVQVCRRCTTTMRPTGIGRGTRIGGPRCWCCWFNACTRACQDSSTPSAWARTSCCSTSQTQCLATTSPSWSAHWRAPAVPGSAGSGGRPAAATGPWRRSPHWHCFASSAVPSRRSRVASRGSSRRRPGARSKAWCWTSPQTWRRAVAAGQPQRPRAPLQLAPPRRSLLQLLLRGPGLLRR